MKFVFFVCFIVGVAFSASLLGDKQDEGNADDVSIGKRAIYQLADMIHCTTGRSIWKYSSYGCHCRKGGRGNPVDATDSCCKTHDDCYKGLKSEGTCGIFELYFTPYDYTTSDCNTANATITCTGSGGNTTTCADELCQCDKAFADCLGDASYNISFKHYPKYLC